MIDELLFLGTGAAQAVPAIYSRGLDASRPDGARADKNLRTRSAFRLGRGHQIDAGPDYYMQSARERMSWFDLEHLFITHTHSDHFNFDGVLQKDISVENNGKPVTIHMSAPALRWFLSVWCYSRTLESPSNRDLDEARESFRPWFEFNVLPFFEWRTVGEIAVCGVPGTHTGRVPDDLAMNLLMELPDGFRMLYGLDTGYYDDETFSFLASTKLDMVVLDCTFGGRTDRGEFPAGHLDCASLVHVVARLVELGTITSDTPVYASHINPDQGLDHDGLARRFASEPYNILPAYDGLRVKPRITGRP
ncbi:MAG: hypothetical protein EA426_00470 [Spirochaetaceae bacterium]|nr:MAG: hypothetical protein EA426_00470 [Spirochaetaceae bacterium]